MPNTNAPMMSDGPSGAMAPPNFGSERGNRHDRERGDRNHDQSAEQAAGLPARQEAPPRCGVAELRLEERNAEAEAADDQRGRRTAAPSSSTSATRIAVAPSAKRQKQQVDAERRAGLAAPPLLPSSLKSP